MTDAEAIRRCHAGEIGAFAQLFEAHQVRAFRTALFQTRDRHLAEDMTQESFVRAYQNIRKCDPDRPFAPWLLRILINLCRTATQRRGRQVPVADVPEAVENDPGFAAVEAHVQVWAVLQHMEPMYQEVLMLKYFHDFTDPETAAALDIPLGTVKSRLHKARQLLEQQMNRRLAAPMNAKEVLP